MWRYSANAGTEHNGLISEFCLVIKSLIKKNGSVNFDEVHAGIVQRTNIVGMGDYLHG